MHKLLMATNDSDSLSAENALYPSGDFNELESTMKPNWLPDTLSVYLEPCEPFPVIDPEPEPCCNVVGPNVFRTDALVDHLNSIVLTESSDLRHTCGKDTGNKITESKRASNQKSTRKSSSSQKKNTKLATRKSRKSGRKPMVDLLAADVGRGQRSNLIRRARPSAWGFVGKIDELFKQNVEKNVDAKGRTGHRGGKSHSDSVNKSKPKSGGELGKTGLLLKLKLGKTAVPKCQLNTIPDLEKDLLSYREVKLEASNIPSDAKENFEKDVYRASNENLDKGITTLKSSINDVLLAEREHIENSCVDPGNSPDSEVINVIPDTQINGNIAEHIRDSSKDCVFHQSNDCGVASGIPSPEIVNDTILCENEIEGSMGSFHQTEVKSIFSGMELTEARSNGQDPLKSSKSKSSVNKNRSSCHEKASSVTGTVEMNDAGGLEEGSRSTAGPLPNSTAVPGSAWVCCDDCHKWRRISTSLADSIESTECRWICKDNMDKEFADCSIPQEKSNADINEELELSDCEEDACNNSRLNSSQLAQKQATDPPQLSWKLIKTNLFLHRNRKNQLIDEVMVCHCKPPIDGRMGCRDQCLNRMLNIECVKGTCPCGDLCSNQQFQKRKYCKLKCVPSGKKGHGLQLQEDIPKGRFLIEYIGEVLDMPSYEARQKEYASKGHKHFYFMTLNGSEVIDACAKGNLGRFINHSCEPNCRTEKWMVNGEVCIGLFAIREIKKGEELTFDYNYVRVFGAAAKKCVCGSSRCRGVIGGDPLNDETVVGDSDDEYAQPVAFYENNNSKSESRVPVTVSAESFYINDGEDNRSPDSLVVPDEKNDDLATLVESTTSASESKIEDTEELLLSVVQPKVKSEVEEQNQITTSVDLLPEHSDSKKKAKSHMNAKKCTILKPKSKSKINSPPPAVKKGKSKSKQIESETKPLVVPQKPKKIVVGNLTGRFEAVEEALNILLTNGGISKRRDASKGYLTLLCLTANGGNGEGIQSNRDLSMILDALLRTKSRTVLLDIINKNGLQMLHILLKRYRKVFNKTPILRKLLKVLEYLAEIKILSLENILSSSLAGVESFKESILSLTEHVDKEVHQIARNFRDRYIPSRYIPWYARRVNRAERETDRMEFQQNSNLKTFPLQQRKPSEVTDNSSIKPSVTPVEGPSASSLTSAGERTLTRTRKRKSRWDEPGDVGPDTQSPSKKEFKSNAGQSQHHQTDVQNMDVDAPPGFSSTTNHHCKTATGQPQDRYVSRLPTAFGLPSSLIKRLGTPNREGTPAESWVVAPGMTFHPFPPLPSYPRHTKEEPWRNCQRDGNSNTLDKRYFKQQKWDYPRSGGGQYWNPNKFGPAGFTGANPSPNPNPNPNQPDLGFGYGRNEAYNAGNSYYQQQQQQKPYH